MPIDAVTPLPTSVGATDVVVDVVAAVSDVKIGRRTTAASEDSANSFVEASESDVVIGGRTATASVVSTIWL